MAVTTTTLSVAAGTVELVHFPFSGMAEIPRDRSDVPRASLVFSTNYATVPGAGAGNTQRLRVSMPFPLNFSYVITDVNYMIVGDTGGATNNFANVATLNVRQSKGPDGTFEYLQFFPMSLAFKAEAAALNAAQNQALLFCLDKAPRQVIIPRDSQDGLVIEHQNATANDQDYSVQLYVRVLQYDVEQANNWAVNTPTPVRI